MVNARRVIGGLSVVDEDTFREPNGTRPNERRPLKLFSLDEIPIESLC